MRRLIYFLPTLLILATGCFNNDNSVPIPNPEGTFSGEFRLLRKLPNVTKIDTTKATIQLILTPGVGFKVLGDTIKVHAGSKGRYGIAGNGIRFVDSTFVVGKYNKRHLQGDYLFVYNGTNLQMVFNSGDSLSLQYDLKKTN
ncbi:hypothetical protein NAF17_11930 [Mucilaginibacter sp. RB4R14]|uniref:hypothetical protein n=1 Tax=Mucilaginibacter aurantiaciroseus TaxID=2949308 RepID=UPI0020914E70|nr:hypothetical protein [Mucilaginibacter aurantiaciroseus]MCO5936248.1 hypothetical protein [Mucilaginibacter aurantiaciroseus]